MYELKIGVHNSFTAREMLLLKNIIEQYPEVYEDEIQEWLEYLTGRRLTIAAIHRCLQKMGWTRRKVIKYCAARNTSLVSYLYQLAS